MNQQVSQVPVIEIIAKILLILAPAYVLASIFPAHRGILYGVGLCIGVMIQLAIPSKSTWKKQLAWLIPAAVLIGVVHALIH
jgi:hypothetical protein